MRTFVGMFAALAAATVLSWGTPTLVLGSSHDLPRAEVNRQKVIDFDGDLVEGVNKRPFDSLSETSDGNGQKKKSHLYKKRKSFRTEAQETIREMRFL